MQEVGGERRRTTNYRRGGKRAGSKHGDIGGTDSNEVGSLKL